jgi:hypothetical protein
MSSTLVETLPAQITSTLTLRGEDEYEHEPEARTVVGHPGPDYPLEPFEHVDPGHAALNDPEPKSFLKGSRVTNLTPRFGTEVSGVQLSTLGKREKR